MTIGLVMILSGICLGAGFMSGYLLGLKRAFDALFNAHQEGVPESEPATVTRSGVILECIKAVAAVKSPVQASIESIEDWNRARWLREGVEESLDALRELNLNRNSKVIPIQDFVQKS